MISNDNQILAVIIFYIWRFGWRFKLCICECIRTLI